MSGHKSSRAVETGSNVIAGLAGYFTVVAGASVLTGAPLFAGLGVGVVATGAILSMLLAGSDYLTGERTHGSSPMPSVP